MIEEVKTGRAVTIQILSCSSGDLRLLQGWRFQWFQVARKSEVYKLVAVENPDSILGLMSIDRQPGFIEIKLLESSPPNVGRAKVYKGIAGSLLSFAGRLSFELENDGVLMLISKTVLIEHYSKTYGFIAFRDSQKLVLGTKASARLIEAFGAET